MTGVELWWLGQAGFRLRDLDNGHVVFLDPFVSAHADRSWQALPATFLRMSDCLAAATHSPVFGLSSMMPAGKGGRYSGCLGRGIFIAFLTLYFKCVIFRSYESVPCNLY